MSVRKDERSISRMQFIETAHEIEKFAYIFCDNPKCIPKSHRHSLGARIIRHAQAINTCVISANGKKMTDEAEAKERVKLLRIALGELDMLEERLRIAFERFPISEGAKAKWAEYICTERATITGAMKYGKERT